MDGITPHYHGGVLWIGQERYRTGIRNGVDPAQLDVDLEADICEILWFCVSAFMTLQTLSCYPNLRVSSVRENRLE